MRSVAAGRPTLGAAKSAWFRGAYEKALRIANLAKSRDIGTASELALIRARALLRLGRPKEAAVAVASVPHPAGDAMARALMLTGAATARIDDVDAGLALLTQARSATLDPTILSEISWYRALALYTERRLDEAESAIAEVTEKADTIYARALQLRGFVAVARERYEPAMTAFISALHSVSRCTGYDAAIVSSSVQQLAIIAAETGHAVAAVIARDNLSRLPAGEERARSLEYLALYDESIGRIDGAYALVRAAVDAAPRPACKVAMLATRAQIAQRAGERHTAADNILHAQEILSDLRDEDFALGDDRFGLLVLAEAVAPTSGLSATAYMDRYETLGTVSGHQCLGAHDRRLGAYETYVRGLITFTYGHRERAAENIRGALRTFRAIGYVRRATLAERVLAEMLDHDALTPSERRVVDILATGVTSTADIARELGLAEKTVRNLMSSAIGKYRVPSRSRLFLQLRQEAGICP